MVGTTIFGRHMWEDPCKITKLNLDLTEYENFDRTSQVTLAQVKN